MRVVSTRASRARKEQGGAPGRPTRAHEERKAPKSPLGQEGFEK